MGFDESFKYNYHQHIDVAEDWRIEEAKHFGLAMYKAGAASRQAEIDELKGRIQYLESVKNGYRDSAIEKQKRIDEALNHLDFYFGDNYSVIAAEKILKGKESP